MSAKVFAAFDQGQVPTIAVINKATVPLGIDLDTLIAALQKAVNEHFAPVWGTPARLVKADNFIAGAWAIVLLDDADVANALGYHDLTPEGLPLSKVFVRTGQKSGEKPEVTASHELFEMLLNPALNLCYEGPRGVMYAGEASDAVEELSFKVDGVTISNFVYPAWFEAFRSAPALAAKSKFDHLGKCSKPFQILKGGYMPVKKKDRWTQIFGSNAKRKRFKREDRTDHRTEILAEVAAGKRKLKRSKS
jgi:hypothetical protein